MKQLKLITKLRGLIVLALALVFSGNSFAGTLTKNPSSTGTCSGTYSNVENAYNSYTNTSSYATITSSTTNSASYVSYKFDLSSIPSNATNIKVNCTVRAKRSTTSNITSTVALYNGTTSVTSSDVTSTATNGATLDMSESSWNYADLSNLQLRFSVTKLGTNTRSDRTMQIYGAEITVTYDVYYSVNCATVTGGTISATPTTATEGTTITLSNTPATGYDFVSYSSDDVTISGNTFTMPANDVTVSGTFQAQTPNAITSFTAASTSVKVGASTTATLVKADGYEGEINYSITNNGAATVTQNGNVFTIVGVANGTVVINATATDAEGFVGNSATITVTVTTSHIPTSYSTEWTTSNQIYLYNKATGTYLGSGGHWGTEGILKKTGLPFYMDKAASANSNATGVGVFSDQGKTTKHKVGYQSSAQVFGIENQGLYIDAGTNYPAQTFSFYFNSDDNSYSIVPDAMVTGFAISGTNSDNETVYLTPGKDQVLSWATVPYYWSMDSNNRLYTVYGSTASSLGTSYYLYTNGSTIYMSTSGSTCAIDDDGYFKIGSTYYLTGNSTAVTSSSSTSSAKGTKYEQSTTSKFYLTRTGGTVKARQEVVTVLQYPTTAIPDEARWFVVTKQDLIDDFENATSTASEGQPKEATFLLANPDFSREVDQGWTFSTTASDYTTGYIRIGNALFNYASPVTTINNANNSIETSDAGVVGTNTTDATLGGNGSGYTLTATDAGYANLPEGTSTYYNIPYGGFYNCRILGESGTISQSVDITTGGWYKISCDAFVYNPSGESGTATLWAKKSGSTTAGKDNVSTAITTTNTFMDMTAAGIYFYNNTTYRQSVMVYLPANSTLQLGVTLTGGKLGTVATSNTSTFVEIDAFKIEYTGDPAYDMVLNELDGGTDQYAGVNYIKAQVYNGNNASRTLYFKRKMTAGKWNSLVLPLNLTAGSVKTAFGDGAELVEFTSCVGNRITFTDIDLSTDGTTVIEAGKCYLVRPSALNCVEYDKDKPVTYSTKIPVYADDNDHKDDVLSVSPTADSPVFILNQVTFTQFPDAIATPVSEPTTAFKPTTDDDITAGLKFMGTYFNISNAIGYGSYAINAADGCWYRYTNRGNLTTDKNGVEPGVEGYIDTYDYSKKLSVKGFRTWIGCLGQGNDEVINAENGNSDIYAKYILVINDEEIEPTDIAGVTVKQPQTITDKRVYNISGQLVGTSDNMSKLPKGIYISNGKKYIVK